MVHILINIIIFKSVSSKILGPSAKSFLSMQAFTMRTLRFLSRYFILRDMFKKQKKEPKFSQTLCDNNQKRRKKIQFSLFWENRV